MKDRSLERYHHGELKEELIRLGRVAIERDGIASLSLRALAAEAGVSKTAPYRHFPDRDAFLVALANEGFRLLAQELERVLAEGGAVPAMGRAYMAFASAHPALYRLMHSELLANAAPAQLTEARRSMQLLGESLARAGGWKLGADGEAGRRFANEAAAAWGYIHGLVMLRIDRLFPAWLPEPDWEGLAERLTAHSAPRASTRRKKAARPTH